MCGNWNELWESFDRGKGAKVANDARSAGEVEGDAMFARASGAAG